MKELEPCECRAVSAGCPAFSALQMAPEPTAGDDPLCSCVDPNPIPL